MLFVNSLCVKHLFYVQGKNQRGEAYRRNKTIERQSVASAKRKQISHGKCKVPAAQVNQDENIAIRFIASFKFYKEGKTVIHSKLCNGVNFINRVNE